MHIFDPPHHKIDLQLDGAIFEKKLSLVFCFYILKYFLPCHTFSFLILADDNCYNLT